MSQKLCATYFYKTCFFCKKERTLASKYKTTLQKGNIFSYFALLTVLFIFLDGNQGELT